MFNMNTLTLLQLKCCCVNICGSIICKGQTGELSQFIIDDNRVRFTSPFKVVHEQSKSRNRGKKFFFFKLNKGA